MSILDDSDKVLGLGRQLVDVLLAILPADKARELLDEAAVRRANRDADIAEAIKFGGGGGQ